MQIQNTLFDSGEFLSLSRQSADLFEKPFSFYIDDHTLVNVLAPGIICFEPISVGNKDIIYSCGVHGNETAPIEICDALVKDILLDKLKLSQRLLIIFGNLKSMDLAQRFVTENMNRLFGLPAEDNISSDEMVRARQIECAVEKFYITDSQDRERIHYDLHTAIRSSKNDKFAVYPYLHEKPWDKSQLEVLLACGVSTILLSGNPTNTFSYFSSRNFGAHSFTVELGKVKSFGKNDMQNFTQVVKTLRQLISSLNVKFKLFDAEDFHIFKVNQVINKSQLDFRLNFADDLANFSDFPKGTVLASETGCEYKAQYDGEAIVFPNAGVEVGQRAMLTVIPTRI
ncbi:succinylglutamate desuccinylase [Paraglaciecola sp.]|uniref:succinylglutamate desuccinylase n=1 Tax=Paraglaciecola sp. TaxID=1920173 RepID=UPI003EFA1926